MSGSPASAPAQGDRSETDDYGDMLDTLDVAIEEIREKIESGRVRSPEHDKVRIKYYRALAYCINVRRQVANDQTLEDLAERLREVEKARGIDT